MGESNSGHIGDDIDKRAGDDPTLYGYRASIEAARFSKHVAAQVYGKAPKYSYVWGGSGGGGRSPACLEYGADGCAGALRFWGGEKIKPMEPNRGDEASSPCVSGPCSMFSAFWLELGSWKASSTPRNRAAAGTPSRDSPIMSPRNSPISTDWGIREAMNS